MAHKILLLKGDGIGPEIVDATVGVLQALRERFGLVAEVEEALMGGCAVDACGEPLPDSTLALASGGRRDPARRRRRTQMGGAGLQSQAGACLARHPGG